MYRIAETKDINKLIELRILQQKENLKDKYYVKDEIFSQKTQNFLEDNLNKSIYFFIHEKKTTNPDAVRVYKKVGFKEVKKRMRLELI